MSNTPETNKISVFKKKKPPTKRQLQAAASKKKIFDTAQALFATYGYENVTVADICEDAGVSVGLFYNYYNSKSDISAEAFQLVTHQYTDCVEHFTPEDTAEIRLLKIARIMLAEICKDDYMLQNARLQYVREAQGIPPFAFDSDGQLHTILLDIVRNGQEQGQLRTDINEHVIVRIFFTYAIGATVHLLNAKDRAKLIEKSLEDLRLIIHGFSTAYAKQLPKPSFE